MKSTITNKFARYVSQNIMGMIGMSLYILPDTFFISISEGANGITALNLVLPLYNLIFAFGAMLGVGSAIRFTILRARKEQESEYYFSNAVLTALICSIPFILAGILFPDKIVEVLGGNETIVAVGSPYTRIFLLFTPFFMWNHICNAFVRNDGNPTIAMTATLMSSLFNIVMDYVFMFPLRMGMAGAALATAVSPIIGIAVCCIHLFSTKSTVKLKLEIPRINRTMWSCRLGTAAFIGEFASGVTTIVFNMLILGLAGNVGVAAYGVIANCSLVAIAVFNGVSQGAQPLFSDCFGKGDKSSVNKVLKMGIVTVLVLALLMILLINIGAESIVSIFNSENNMHMESYAVSGIKLYFIGFVFAGVNIIGTGYLSAVEEAGWAFAASILRGVVAIIVFAVVLSLTVGLSGVWLAFPVAEGFTLCVTISGIVKSLKRKKII